MDLTHAVRRRLHRITISLDFAGRVQWCMTRERSGASTWTPSFTQKSEPNRPSYCAQDTEPYSSRKAASGMRFLLASKEYMREGRSHWSPMRSLCAQSGHKKCWIELSKAQGDLEGNFRRVWLLYALLEDYFALRGMWYEGPKAALKWLR